MNVRYVPGAVMRLAMVVLVLIAVAAPEAQAKRHWFSGRTIGGETIPDAYSNQAVDLVKDLRSASLTNGLIDVTMSIDKEVPQQDRATYEAILGHFADGVYEMTEGQYKIRNVRIYQNGHFSGQVDIVWSTQNGGRPCSGGMNNQSHISMFDVFSVPEKNYSYDLIDDASGAGYTMAHEWGHYFFTLYDEYLQKRDGDLTEADKPKPSIMNHQWNARGGHYGWLNFSIALGASSTQDGMYETTTKTKQWAVYHTSDDAGGSAWETLSRDPKDDPKDAKNSVLGTRTYYPEVAGAAPQGSPNLDLPGTARSALNPIWMDEKVVYEIVIDRSGSMLGSPLENAKTAAKLLVDRAPEGSSAIGIIEFDSSVTVVSDITAIGSASDKATLKSRIDAITSTGSTAIGAAARGALNAITAYGQDNESKIVFLLSDGESNSGEAPLNVIPDYRAAQIPLMTFGYGSGSDSATLQAMADQTGGSFYSTPTTAAEIAMAFQDANVASSPNTGIISASSPVPAGTTASKDFVVDASLGTLNVMATYSGTAAAASVSLRTPGGLTVNPGNVYESGSETIVSWTVDAPQAGTWHFAITSGQTVDYDLKVDGTPLELTYNLEVDNAAGGSTVAYPSPMIVTANLKKGVGIAKARILATVTAPNGTTSPLLLLDDGKLPDTQANDGIYTATVAYTMNGSYNITVNADNAAGTALFTTSGLEMSTAPDGSVLPVPSPWPVNENFARSDFLQVSITGFSTDDHGNTTSSATSIAPDNTDVAGKIDSASDVDFFTVVVPQAASIFAVRVTDPSKDFKPSFTVFNTSGQVLASKAWPGGRGYPYALLKNLQGQRLYVRVESGSGTAKVGTYNVSASDAPLSSDRFVSLGATMTTVLPLMLEKGDPYFRSDFTADAAGWVTISGAWSVANGNYTTPGLGTDAFWSSVSTLEPVADADVSAVMRRTGCSTCANALFVRGEPSPLDVDLGWGNGYYFGYANAGYYLVGKLQDGVFESWTDWVQTQNVVDSGYNQLRIRMSGGTLIFYLNGSQVYATQDTTFSSGKVGIGMWTDEAGDVFAVDYAEVARLQAGAGDMPAAGQAATPRGQGYQNRLPQAAGAARTAPAK